jgi:hypothetical protein
MKRLDAAPDGGIVTARQKFASQADPAVLAEVRAIADEDGRQLQAVIEDALRDYVAARRGGHVRREVLDHLDASVRDNAALYERLAR